MTECDLRMDRQVGLYARLSSELTHVRADSEALRLDGICIRAQDESFYGSMRLENTAGRLSLRPHLNPEPLQEPTPGTPTPKTFKLTPKPSAPA